VEKKSIEIAKVAVSEIAIVQPPFPSSGREGGAILYKKT